jgi:hypothetical protein
MDPHLPTHKQAHKQTNKQTNEQPKSLHIHACMQSLNTASMYVSSEGMDTCAFEPEKHLSARLKEMYKSSSMKTCTCTHRQTAKHLHTCTDMHAHLGDTHTDTHTSNASCKCTCNHITSGLNEDNKPTAIQNSSARAAQDTSTSPVLAGEVGGGSKS